MESQMDKDMSFNFVYFINWLKDNNVFSVAVAAVLSDRVSDIINKLLDTFITPILDRDADNDGVRDIKKFEDYTIEISGMKFKIGQLLLSIFKFLIVTYGLYIVYLTLKKIDSNLV